MAKGKDPAPRTKLGRAVRAQDEAVKANDQRRFRRASAMIEKTIADRDAKKLRLP